MPLSSHRRLGPYEILGPLAAGGMGEVYRARDTRLDREVAIKVLPDRLSTDPEALARFEREAKAVAALSHPNILAIHDFGLEDGVAYSVTELLRGQNLREKIGSSPLPVRKAVDYALQIARGLAAAHDRGIVHRDLKPDNLFVTDDGLVKILDFGLAKFAGPDQSALLTQSPTLDPGTRPGSVLGTLGYMSPEQVRGLAVDPRSDLFAFGAIVYEMLSGQRAFRRDTSADTLSAILKEEPPDLSGIHRGIPPALERLVQHCLEKNPAERFQSARDLAFHLEALSTASGTGEVAAVPELPAGVAARRRIPIPLLAGLAAGLLIGAALGAWLRHPPALPPPTLRNLTYSGKDSEPSASPDGRLIAYVSLRKGPSQIWLKQFPGGNEVDLTSGPDLHPRISPDGSQVLFARQEGSRSSLFKVPVVGGEPRKVVDDALDGDWSPDGSQVVFVRGGEEGDRVIVSVGIVGAAGGEPKEIARIENRHLVAPRWSPDGSTLAFIRTGTENAPNDILLMSADGKDERSLRPPPPASQLSAATWSGDGSALVYAQSVGFASAIAGAAAGRIVRQDVRSGSSEILMWVPASPDLVDILAPGTLLMGSSSRRQNLLEVPLQDRPGSQANHWLTRGNSVDRQPTFSPDGQWVLFSSNRSGNLDLWKLSLASGALRRITEDRADDWDPAFTADGRQIVWSSGRAGHFEIWICDADGAGARQLTRDGVDAENPTATADGAWIVYNSGNPAKSGIWKIHLDGTSAQRIVPGVWSTPDVSPDGAYVAYRTSALPRTVLVARFADGKDTGISLKLPGSGFSGRPRWMPGGKTLAFTGTDDSGALGVFLQAFSPGRDTRATRRAVAGFDPNSDLESFAIAPDGSRLVASMVDALDSIMLAEGLPGISPPKKKPR